MEALEHCRRRSSAILVCCDAASAFANKFDLIVSNPPYLPNDDPVEDLTIHGGPTGIETTTHFIRSALPVLALNGKMLLVSSSLTDSTKLDMLVAEVKIQKKVVKEKRLFYEIISVIELSP